MVFWLRCRTIPSIPRWHQDSYPYINHSITMYNKLQLDIIREFGSKELTEGLVIIHENQIWKIIWNKWYNFLITYEKQWKEFESKIWEVSEYFIKKDCEILWHIPYLEDVFRVAEEREIALYVDNIEKEIRFFGKEVEEYIPFNPTIQLLDQSESTLTQLLTLFKNDKN